MKVINLSSFALVILSCLMSSTVQSRLDHICSASNESVVKFRKSLIKHDDSAQALKICLADNILHKKGIRFVWPIDLCDFWVSSLFGPRTHRGETKMHGGIDLAALKGTAIVAAAAGTVTRAESNVPAYGTLVEIDHGHGFMTRYGHIDQCLVSVGDVVKRGEMIATVGATGRVRGTKDPSHLHFEILKDGKKVNPLQYLYCSEVAFDVE